MQLRHKYQHLVQQEPWQQVMVHELKQKGVFLALKVTTAPQLLQAL